VTRRTAFVYHRIAPETLGGAERFYAALSRQFAADGSAAVLVSMHHWAGPRRLTANGVERIGLARPGGVADTRVGRFGPKLRWALALFWHLLRHGGGYDVVHCCCFPHVSVVACRLALLAHRRTALVVDWHEVLPRSTWRRRLGLVGLLGWLVQRLAVLATPVGLTFSALHAGRLREEGFRGRVEVVPEFLPDGDVVAAPAQRETHRVLFAGRLVREKHPEVVPAVVAALRRTDPRWHAVVLGDGPETVSGDGVDARGYVSGDELAEALRTSTVLLHPSEREGFGLAVLEALAYGLPVVVVAAPDNASTDLVDDGVTGVVCADGSAATLAAAVLAAWGMHAGAEAWWAANAATYSVAGCAARLRALHESVRGR